MRIYNNKQTLPLNGWRSRALAKYQFNNYHADNKLTEGFKFLVPAEVIQNLPDFDTVNQAYADSFTGMLVCTVEKKDHNYGVHISLAQAEL